jgi:hypothetical protein
MARVTGLEPATSGVTGRHSNQLSYTRFAKQPCRFEVALMYGGSGWKSSTVEALLCRFCERPEYPPTPSLPNEARLWIKKRMFNALQVDGNEQYGPVRTRPNMRQHEPAGLPARLCERFCM